MRLSKTTAASLATAVVTIFMAQPAHALDGALAVKLMGCYQSNQGLTLVNTTVADSAGFCQTQCFPLGKPVMAMTGGKECWCGDQMPNLSTKVDDSKCSQSCYGYPDDICMTFELLISIVNC